MCKISIIVPCFKVEKYLERCLDSLRNQMLQEVEIILVDDGSPDRVPQICDEYARRDSRIKVVHKENEGLGYARNSGLNIASGDYVAFVDSDDFVELNMYQTLYDEAQKENADVVFCNFLRETQNGDWIECKEVAEETKLTGSEIRMFMLDMIASPKKVKKERKCQMSVWHAIYKRSTIEKRHIRFLSEREIASEDIPFNVDFLSQCKKVVYCPDCFYHYCMNGTSLTATFLDEKFNRYKKLYSYLKEKTGNLGDGSLERTSRFLLGMTRTQILHLLKSDTKNKKLILKKYVDDSIWYEVKKQFKCEWLPLPAAVFTWLLFKRQVILLYCYATLYNYLKKIK